MEHSRADVVEALARALYGETDYDALPEGQVKTAYRRHAQKLVNLAPDCVAAPVQPTPPIGASGTHPCDVRTF